MFWVLVSLKLPRGWFCTQVLCRPGLSQGSRREWGMAPVACPLLSLSLSEELCLLQIHTKPLCWQSHL